MMNLDGAAERTPDKTKKLYRVAALVVIAIAAVILAVFEIGKPVLTEDTLLNGFYTMTVTRMAGAAVFFVLIGYQGYRVLNPIRKPFWRSLLVTLPAFAVVINNLPILPLLNGTAHLTHSGEYLVWYVAECVSIGLFEEAAFRGILLLMICEKKRASSKDLFWSIVKASAVFGAIHLVNLLINASFGGVIQQIGYSFLIGAMCSVVLYKTANLWLCVLLHAVYDFCGGLVPALGEGIIWDTPTIVITVILAVAVTIYMVVLLFRIKPEELDRIYDKTP